MVRCELFRSRVAFISCAKCAGWSGIIQSLTTLIFAILCISFVVYEREDRYGKWHVLHPSNFTNKYWGVFYVDYLVDSYGRTTTLYVAAALYIPLAIIWFIASILILLVVRTEYVADINRDKRSVFCIFTLWSIVTYVICLMHLIFAILSIWEQFYYLSKPVNIPIREKSSVPRSMRFVMPESKNQVISHNIYKKNTEKTYELNYISPKATSTSDTLVEMFKIRFYNGDFNRSVEYIFGDNKTTQGISKVEKNFVKIIPPESDQTPASVLNVKRKNHTFNKRSNKDTTFSLQTDLTTYMNWNNTILIDHEPARDRDRVEVLFPLLLLFTGFMALWLLNFILSTYLLASPFEPRDCYESCSCGCKCFCNISDMADKVAYACNPCFDVGGAEPDMVVDGCCPKTDHKRITSKLPEFPVEHPFCPAVIQ